LDIALVAFDDNGKIARQIARTQTLHVPAATYEQFLGDGVIESIVVPMQSPGAYQLRLVVRDAASGKLGSDSQFVEVPDIKKTRLTISGLVVQHVEPDALMQHATETSRTSVAGTDSDRARKGPAVRQFNAGDLLTYSYLVNGALGKREINSPNLVNQIRLFHADKEIFTGKELPVVTTERSGSGDIVAGGNLRLGTALSPGNYFLQIIVTDKLAPVEKQVSDQWIDFEIMK
jgi:hypothetical protein